MNLVPFNKLINELKIKVKPEILITIVIVVIIGLIFACTYFSGNNTKNTDNINSNSINISKGDLEALEEKMSAILSNIKGAGRVRVMVTYESGPEIVPVFGTDREVSTVQEGGDNSRRSEQIHEKTDPATLDKNGSSEALILKELNPEIRGVIVIAEGASEIGVKIRLLQAVTTVLNITADKVDVFEMN